MNAKLKQLVRRLRYTEGKLDCANGKSPQRTTPFYLQGYSEQYAQEHILNALTPDTF